MIIDSCVLFGLMLFYNHSEGQNPNETKNIKEKSVMKKVDNNQEKSVMKKADSNQKTKRMAITLALLTAI